MHYVPMNAIASIPPLGALSPNLPAPAIHGTLVILVTVGAAALAMRRRAAYSPESPMKLMGPIAATFICIIGLIVLGYLFWSALL